MATALQTITVRAPGLKGLQTENSTSVLDPSAARTARNLVFDKTGRIQARKGKSVLTSSALTGTPVIESMHMLDTSGGNKLIFGAQVSSTNKIYESVSPFSSNTDVTGSLSPTGNNWQFQNFNDKTIAAQGGNTMIVKTHGGASFAAISAASGTVPTGNCVHSAFGRLWAQKVPAGSTDQAVVAYSALLDETHWSTGAGEINALGTASAVAAGYDEMMGISSISGFLVVFFKNSIVIYGKPEDPTNMTINRVIQGVGLLERDSVQQIGDDLVFLTRVGVRSLKQTIRSDDNTELHDLSATVRSDLLNDVSTSDTPIKSAWYPDEALYLLKADNHIWVMDMHQFKEQTTTELLDPTRYRWTVFPSTGWDNFAYHEGTLYIGDAGALAKYDGYQDAGASYTCEWMSMYFDYDSTQTKFLKNLKALVEGAYNQQFTFKWSFDFDKASGTAVRGIPSSGTVAEYGSAEYGIAEWNGGFSINILRVHGSRSGQFVSFGFTCVINGSAASMEEIAISMKIGRETR